MSELSRYGHALTQRPDFHWLDLPDDPDSEPEEPEPEHKPLSSFTDGQTVLVAYPPRTVYEFPLSGPKREKQIPWRLLEFPVDGDEYHLGSKFNDGGYVPPKVFGYVLQRSPEFEASIYGWAKQR